VACVGALAASGTRVGAQATGAPTRPRTTYEDLQMFTGVLNQIRVNHPDSVDSHEMIMAAIRGMLSAADPHSYVITYEPVATEKAKQLRDGKLYPVGISFRFYGGSPIVVGVAPGSSAMRANVLPGDELVAIDGAPVAATSADELDVVLAGKRGSTVRLTVERQRSDGSLVRVDRDVAREKIGEESAVPSAFMVDAKTGYLRVTTFANVKVAEDLHAALGRLEKDGMERLVLDLRDNGGGSVREAAQVAGEFLPKGAVVYAAEGRKKDVIDTGRVERSFWRSEKRYPIVLLVNSNTASASELVAGALQDHDRALIVGVPTFGKSLLRQLFPLPDGSLLWMVTGHVKTPCGRVVQRQYRNLTTREYYRRARADRDTLSRPSCKTDGGRVVYGGGGIYPDVRLVDRGAVPLWFAKIEEDMLPMKWVGGYVGANAAAFPSLDALAAAPVLPPAALDDFRRFATQQGVTIPTGPEIDRGLSATLLAVIANAKWGDGGYYRIAALLDPDVRTAIGAFDRAAAMLGR
jgi:carboxyl-terminal processing protease